MMPNRTSFFPGKCAQFALVFMTGVSLSAYAQQQPNELDHAIEMYISEDALQALYIREMNTNELGSIQVRAGAFYNEDRDLIAILDGLTLVGTAERSRRLELRVGPRAYGAFLGIENEDIFGIAVGGEASYRLGADRSTAVVLTAFYAPDILTFGQADNMTDVSLRIETELRPDIDIYVGARSFEIDLASGDREVDDNLHIGFRRRF